MQVFISRYLAEKASNFQKAV